MDSELHLRAALSTRAEVAKRARKAFRENLLLALDTLRTHKFRSLLTILGVLIGTMTVIAVASIIAGLDRQVVEIAEQFGTRTIWVMKMDFSVGRMTREERMRKPLTFEDAMAIREQCPSVEEVSAVLFKELHDFGPPPTSVKYKGQEMLDAQFAGATPEHMRLVNASIADGRFFTQTDDLHRRDVAVIGDAVSERFFANEDPIGKSILVDGHAVEVIGVFTKFKGLLGDNSDDRSVMVPYQTFKKFQPMAKENFLIVLAYPGRVGDAMEEMRGLLRRRRHVKLEDPDSFGFGTAELIVRQLRDIMSTVVLVTVVISSVGLLVGGIGVMNIMLVSVTERTREIGVRKAIGARRSDITWQFLLEAMTLTGLGGVLGILAGITISMLVRTFVPSLPSSVPLWSVAAGFAVAVSVGLFFGIWPALKASRLDPIVALRYE
ncbi:MAG: ABC transporter permease [Acidobacteria bacterium]|nr:ABC transporter permease [Acidobacteriota bacterium]